MIHHRNPLKTPWQKLLRGAFTLAAIGLLGSFMWVFIENQILTPTRRTLERLNGVPFDPNEHLLKSPLRRDEGFLCSGTALRNGYIPNLKLKGVPWRVKVLGRFPDGSLRIVQLQTTDADEDTRYYSPYTIDSQELRKSLPCPPRGRTGFR